MALFIQLRLSCAMLCGVKREAGILEDVTSFRSLEWRNWQTHGTQNPAAFTGHESSTLSSSTTLIFRRTVRLRLHIPSED